MAALEEEEESDVPCCKRQRLDNKSLCCSLSSKNATQEPLQLLPALTCPPNLQAWKTVLSQMQQQQQQQDVLNDSSLLVKSWMSFHSTLLLHLGYTLRKYKAQHVECHRCHDDDTTDIIITLFQCWQRLLEITECCIIQDQEEVLQEALRILIRTQDCCHVMSPLLLTSWVEIAVRLVQVLEEDARLLMAAQLEESCLDAFSKSLLQVVGREASCIRPTERAFGALQKLAAAVGRCHNNNNNSQTSIYYASARIIMCFTTGKQHYGETKHALFQQVQDGLVQLGLSILHSESRNDQEEWANLPLHHHGSSIPEHDALLFLRGLCYSSELARRLSNNSMVVNHLKSSLVCHYKEHSVQAAVCLAAIAQQCDVASPASANMTRILVSQLYQNNEEHHEDDHSTTTTIISGLLHLTQGSSNMTILLEHSTSLLPLLDFLNDRIQSTHDRDAARLVCRITSRLARSPQCWAADPWNTTMDIIALILSVPALSEMALTLLCELASTAPKALDLVHSSSAAMLPTLVAHVLLDRTAACRDYSSTHSSATTITATAVDLYWHLSRHSSAVLPLARAPKVLAALIAVSSRDNQHNDLLRRKSLQTLFRLSQFAVNRRVLAKQPGLLACLIRFARDMTEEDVRLMGPKEELKRNILQIAELL